MRLLVAPAGYERESELAVVGAVKAVESLAKHDARVGHAPVTGSPVYIAVFSYNEGIADVSEEVRRVVTSLVSALAEEKVA